MGGRWIFLKIFRASLFNKDLPNEPNFGLIHLAKGAARERVKNGLIGIESSVREPRGVNEAYKEILSMYVQAMPFLPYVFTQTLREMTTSHQRSILKIQKPLEVPI
jgi:hypothetical protein